MLLDQLGIQPLGFVDLAGAGGADRQFAEGLHFRVARRLAGQEGLQGTDRVGIFLQRQQQRSVGQFGVGLQRSAGVVDHRQQRRQGVFVAAESLVAHGQQIAVFQVLRPEAARAVAADQGLQQGDGLSVLLAFDQRRASIRCTSPAIVLLGNRSGTRPAITAA